MRRLLQSAVALVLIAACQGGSQTSSPPIFPQDLPVPLEPVALENFDLPRPPLLQTTILNPLLRAAAQTDDFKQTQALLDVLFVVSNAGEMAIERDRLAQNLQAFTSVLSAAKDTWQIGVTSSDLSVYLLANGTLHAGDGGNLHGPTPLISPQDPNVQQDFSAALTWNIQRNSAPSQTAIFASMQLALQAAVGDAGQSGLLRPGASLAVIAAANNDDESFGDPAYFARYLKGLKGKGNEGLVTFSALAGPKGGCTPPGEAQIFGAHVDSTPRLQALTTATGGVFESICDEANFNTSLAQIAQNIASLRRYFPLSAPADPATLVVTVDGAPVAGDSVAGWQYLPAINSVAFLGSYVPDPGSDVRISYAVQ